MQSILSGTAFIAALAIAAPGSAAITFHPFGGSYYPESAPSPPSTILEPAPHYYPPATVNPYPYDYRYYGGPYWRGY
jgi:hypothetical protein